MVARISPAISSDVVDASPPTIWMRITRVSSSHAMMNPVAYMNGGGNFTPGLDIGLIISLSVGHIQGTKTRFHH
jgi:hypothetical protein